MTRRSASLIKRQTSSLLTAIKCKAFIPQRARVWARLPLLGKYKQPRKKAQESARLPRASLGPAAGYGVLRVVPPRMGSGNLTSCVPTPGIQTRLIPYTIEHVRILIYGLMWSFGPLRMTMGYPTTPSVLRAAPLAAPELSFFRAN